MMFFLLKILVAACVISFASWLAGKRPELAGFIIALPVGSLLALAFAQGEHHDPQTAITLARSILVALPVSLLFFLPFFFTEKIGYGFWPAYAIGIVLLALGYCLHQAILGWLK